MMQGTMQGRKDLGQPRVPPKVFIIVLNWNGWMDTVNCLRSLESLDYPNYRVVVVDNGSTDGSQDRLRQEGQDLQIVETGENLGFAGGNNVGIRHSLKQAADYVWLLNNDTTVERGTLSAMVETAEGDPRIGAAGSVLYHMEQPQRIQFWGGGRINLWMGTARSCTSPVPAERISYLTGASMLLRRQALEEVGLFDEGFFICWEDTDLSFRLGEAGWRLAVAQDSRVWHKGSATLRRNNVLAYTYFSTSAVRFFRRHAPLPFVPIMVGTAGRLLMRLLRRDWQGARGIVRSLRTIVNPWSRV